MVPERKLVKVEKQVSIPLVFSCTLMKHMNLDIMCIRINIIVLVYIYIHNIYMIKYKACEQMLGSWM